MCSVFHIEVSAVASTEAVKCEIDLQSDYFKVMLKQKGGITTKRERGAGGPDLSLSLSSCLVRLQSCRVSSCWVTSSAQRQFTSSLSCSGAL